MTCADESLMCLSGEQPLVFPFEKCVLKSRFMAVCRVSDLVIKYYRHPK